MYELIIFILVCYGATDIVVNGSLFEGIRNKLKWKLFCCPMCLGFHWGYIIFVLLFLSGYKLYPNIYIGSFLFACISSGTSSILCSIFDDWGIKISLRDKKE